MEIEKLKKSDFADVLRGKPTIRFTAKGIVVLNKRAVAELKLFSGNTWGCVSICRDTKDHSEFSITRDKDGWQLREAYGGGAVFNCAGLSRHVIDKTWERCQSHPVGVEKPVSCSFRIAHIPVDDDKNKDVYALIRKKV